MTHLARRLRLVDYFSLGFGVMVGTAWLVVMDDILRRGGPLGAILGFTAGALMLLPIGYVYGQLIRAIPDAGGEAAYVQRFYPLPVSFATGWMVLLSYFLTCPFEGLAAGRLAGYLFPSINRWELYRLGGHPVYAPHIALGFAITMLLTWINFRGIQSSARLSKATTFTFLVLVCIFAASGAQHGSAQNLRPLFSHSPLISILLVWQIVPWLLAGFESVGKYAEESSPDFRGRGFAIAIWLTILAGLLFFWTVISAVSFVTPWTKLDATKQFPTAMAFETAFHAHWIVVLIMSSAFVALVQAFNANIVASSRMLYAMGRHRLVDARFGAVHESRKTPHVALLCIAVATGGAMLLGDAGLVPILEVGAVSSAIAWMAACASYVRMKPSIGGYCAAIFGILVTTAMVAVKVLPFVPGHFTRWEWLALLIWGSLGAFLYLRARATAPSLQVEEAVAGSNS